MSLLKIRKKGGQEALALTDIPKAGYKELAISDQAALFIKKLMNDHLKPFLRISIRGGGCSGLTINYELSDKERLDDSFFENDQAKIAIDKKSLSILGGATVHCREYLGIKELFLANNPAEKQCSCGQSFSL